MSGEAQFDIELAAGVELALKCLNLSTGALCRCLESRGLEDYSDKAFGNLSCLPWPANHEPCHHHELQQGTHQ